MWSCSMFKISIVAVLILIFATRANSRFTPPLPGEPRKCNSPSIVCGTTCTDITSDSNNCGGCGIKCGQQQKCSSEHCINTNTCNSPLTKCGTDCTLLSQDPFNCGKCNNPCGEYGEGCQNSQCVCVPWAISCSGKCVDPSTDSNNCNGCGKMCPLGQLCFNGVCT